MQQLYNLITDLLWYLRKLNIKRSWASLDCNCVIGLWIQFIIVERWISALGYGLSHQLPSQVCLIKTLYICQFIVFFIYSFPFWLISSSSFVKLFVIPKKRLWKKLVWVLNMSFIQSNMKLCIIYLNQYFVN